MKENFIKNTETGEIIYRLNEEFPELIEDFISLEGEGIGVGIPSLFIRTNRCNNTCTFCDTAFSIPGKKEKVIKFNDKYVDSRAMLVEYLASKYSAGEREYVKNCTITGGEPLLNIDNLAELVNTITIVFSKIKRIVIETNGGILNEKQNCFKLIEQLSKVKTRNIEFILSISPKLDNRISHAGALTEEEVFDMYKRIIDNYTNLLDRHTMVQIKFVHSNVLAGNNEKLINYILNGITKPFNRNNILIMPFTPRDPFEKDKQLWEESKNEAAVYALKYKYRYSPRLHIDRKLK